jgi:DNA ligase 1
MNRFAELLDRLTYEPSRNAKLRLMTDYFRSTSDPERGWALAALTGALTFPHAKPGLIRSLIAERTDPVLFELSYDYVGDLSETIALMWPKRFPSPLVNEEGRDAVLRHGGTQARQSSPAHDLATLVSAPSPRGRGEEQAAAEPAAGRSSSSSPAACASGFRRGSRRLRSPDSAPPRRRRSSSYGQA